MVENIADPLLAGVYGGDSAALSVRSVLPRFWEMERQHGSLTRATLKAMRQRQFALAANGGHGSAPAHAGNSARKLPLFMTLKGGLQQMTQKLAAQADKYRVYLRRRVLALEFAPGGPGGAADSCSRRFQITCDGGKVYDADAVVLALPAHLAGGLLSSLDQRLSELLEGIPYSSSMTVSLGFDEQARATLPAGFGFLVPRKERRRMLACTFVHAKFNHRVPEGKAMLRCFLGGARDPEVLGLDDDEVVAVVRRELRGDSELYRRAAVLPRASLAGVDGAISGGPRRARERHRGTAAGPARTVPGRKCLLGNRHFGLHPDGEERGGEGRSSPGCSKSGGRGQWAVGRTLGGRVSLQHLRNLTRARLRYYPSDVRSDAFCKNSPTLVKLHFDASDPCVHRS